MPPQQPNNQGQDPYEFITNPPPKKKWQFNFGKTPAQKAIIVAAGLVFLIVAFLIISSMLNSASNTHKERLAEMAQTQTEIIRITDMIEDYPSADGTKHIAATTRSTLRSDLQETTNMLARRGTEIDSKILAQKENQETDEALERASANNRFDERFLTILQQQLEGYRALLQTTNSSAASSEQEVFAQNYDDINLLLGRVKSQQQ